MQILMREMFLEKNREIFIFRCPIGLEHILLDAMIELAESKKTIFDILDAQALSVYLAEPLINEADVILNDENWPWAERMN